MPTSGGFLLTEDGVKEVTTDDTGATWQTGFLRGPVPEGEGLGPLVVTTDDTGAAPSGGYLRSPDGALVVAEDEGVYESGIGRTASGALAVNTGAPDFGQVRISGLSPPSDPPVNTVAPAITGVATVGHQVFCTRGTWQNSPSSYARQWKRGGVTIVGATSQAYTLTGADEGESIICTVTATNVIGSTDADSNTIVPAAGAIGGTLVWGSGLWNDNDWT